MAVDPSQSSVQPSNLHLPGVLTVTLHDAAGLSVPDHPQGFLNSPLEARQVTDGGSAMQRYSAAPRGQNLPYAVLDFDKSQVFPEASGGSIQDPIWCGDSRRYRFNVYRAAELTIRLYLGTASASSPDVFLGEGKVALSTTLTKPSVKWLHLLEGTGKIGVGLGYAESEVPQLRSYKSMEIIGKLVSRVCTRYQQTCYALKEVRKSDEDSVTNLSRQLRLDIDNSFVAPLQMVFLSPNTLNLLSPFTSGGHLFYYLQRVQRFDAAEARFYAAELVCALEYLHHLDIVCYDLKPANILLDSLGHVVLCDFSNFQPPVEDGVPAAFGKLEYPALEQLTNGAHTKTVDWWTFGVFLYEMLMGLPPFYAESTDEVHCKILSQSVQFPEWLSPMTRDLLLRLFHHDPERRLGAKGASEIKDDPLFHNVDWPRLLRRGYEAPFRPREVAMHFEHREGQTKGDAYQGFSYNSKVLQPLKKKVPSGDQVISTTFASKEPTLAQAVMNGDRELTKAIVQRTGRVDSIKALGLAVEEGDGTIVCILLDGGVNCDFQEEDQPVPPHPDYSCASGCDFWSSSVQDEFEAPLTRAVKLQNLDIAKILLARGADPNTAFHDLSYPLWHDIPSESAFKCGRVVQLAVNHHHEEMVQLLLDWGANAEMPMHVWQGHDCPPIPRSIYLKMIARLRQQVEKHRNKTI